jgi:biotin transport system substrate-specific component
MTSAVISQRAFPRSGVVSVLLLIAAAALTALAAQWRIHLPFTPVPITGQTFAVLLTGAGLGWKLGASGQLLYLAVGALGAPVFSDASGGVDVVVGVTGGYLIGFVLAAGVVGWMAEHRQDRTFATMFTAFILGSAVIYVCGVTGLMISADMQLPGAVEAGVVPFLLGDLLKAAVAGILLPGAWRFLGDRALSIE